jgi:hypothetical protein
MKVRIHGNSIRFRLTEHETGSLSTSGTVSEALEFGTAADAVLQFSLQVTDSNQFSCIYECNSFVFFLPRNIVKLWLENSDAGLSQMVETPGGKQLKLVVEKDFPCSHLLKHEVSSGVQFH